MKSGANSGSTSKTRPAKNQRYASTVTDFRKFSAFVPLTQCINDPRSVLVNSMLLAVVTWKRQLQEHTVLSDVEKVSSRLVTISHNIRGIKAASLNKQRDASSCEAKLICVTHCNKNWERQTRSLNRSKMDYTD